MNTGIRLVFSHFSTGVTMNKRLYNLLALLMLGLFFLPYIVKIKQWDLVFILIAGLLLPAIDFFTSKDDEK